MSCTKPRPSTGNTPDVVPPAKLSDFIAALDDPGMRQYLKSQLSISDEQLDAHIRRLVEATTEHDAPDPSKK